MPRSSDLNRRKQPPCPSIAVFPVGEVEHGAMTDAAKRRFDPEAEIGLDDEFEMVQTGNFYDPNDLQIDLASVIAEARSSGYVPCAYHWWKGVGLSRGSGHHFRG